ncbi:hypothetical protein J4475_04175 [Candidatus Woesearchaeota archaeon]|nr:hypothetical protein [Candidatus Woesearchaeota archaeon]
MTDYRLVVQRTEERGGWQRLYVSVQNATRFTAPSPLPLSDGKITQGLADDMVDLYGMTSEDKFSFVSVADMARLPRPESEEQPHMFPWAERMLRIVLSEALRRKLEGKAASPPRLPLEARLGY